MAKEFIDLTGKTFGEWTVLEYEGKRKWLCRCTCGVEKLVDGKTLYTGQSKSCGHNTKKLQDLTNKQFGEWKVIKHAYEKNHRHYWLCQCSCGTLRELDSYSLTSGHSVSCGHDRLIDITGQKFGELTVLEYAGNKKWKCQCSCGRIKLVNGRELRNGSTKTCGSEHPKYQDLTGQTFGEWTVLRYLGNQIWECQCSCGKISSVSSKNLRTGESKSCGHNRLNDLTNKQINNLLPIRYLGDRRWECKCLVCGRLTIKNTQLLTSGRAKSCGCDRGDKLKALLISRYGETAPARIDNPRQEWQIKVVESKEEFSDYLDSFEHKPTINELVQLLDTSQPILLKKIHKYNLENKVNIQPFYSAGEVELRKFIGDNYKGNVEYNSRKIISNGEIDIYLPELKLAFEFNGNYWHSDKQKDKCYHLMKSIKCGKQGIRLVHIFEYEWYNERYRDKTRQFILYLLNEHTKVYYARETHVAEVSKDVASNFIEAYHLQGNTQASIYLGCYSKDKELLGVMSIGTPRFDRDYQYEIIRIAWKNDTRVIGGMSKLFTNFVRTYDPESVISYCDISKFNGSSYIDMGFSLDKAKQITEPNYVWVDSHNNVLTRYQTMKKDLVKRGLGKENQTEEEIMDTLGYFRVYNSGNFRFIWKR